LFYFSALFPAYQQLVSLLISSSSSFFLALLYKNPSVFNDIVNGNNRCAAATGGAPVCCKSGFDALKGWDPLTGHGSIDFGKAVAAFV